MEESGNAYEARYIAEHLSPDFGFYLRKASNWQR